MRRAGTAVHGHVSAASSSPDRSVCCCCSCCFWLPDEADVSATSLSMALSFSSLLFSFPSHSLPSCSSYILFFLPRHHPLALCSSSSRAAIACYSASCRRVQSGLSPSPSSLQNATTGNNVPGPGRRLRQETRVPGALAYEEGRSSRATTAWPNTLLPTARRPALLL